MHIIIEGPDGAGKTTLAHALMKRSSRRYHHEGPPPKGVPALSWYAHQLLKPAPHIYDRLHLGQVVYPRATGRGGELSPLALKLLRRVINGTGSRVVLLLPPYSLCHERWAARVASGHEMFPDETVFKKTWAEFAKIFVDDYTVYAVNKNIDHCYSGVSGERIFDELLEPRRRCPEGVIGSPEATVLVVGEIANGLPDAPFMAETNSSGFLNEALEAIRLPECDLALTNAYDRHGHPRPLRFLADQLPNLKRVVLLGRRAELVWGDGDPRVRAVPHPSYWRRFHAHESDRYADQLREAVYGE